MKKFTHTSNIPEPWGSLHTTSQYLPLEMEFKCLFVFNVVWRWYEFHHLWHDQRTLWQPLLVEKLDKIICESCEKSHCIAWSKYKSMSNIINFRNWIVKNDPQSVCKKSVIGKNFRNKTFFFFFDATSWIFFKRNKPLYLVENIKSIIEYVCRIWFLIPHEK